MTKSQQLAADPEASVWVTASAGTGKTKVLTDRVLRLLLGGTDPGRILCLTFTRAAAAEMSIRITRTLGEWTAADDEALDEALGELMWRAPSVDELVRARLLFARVLETPGGMKILTIHAFCQSLLRRFPLEAGIAPHFAVADDGTARELQNEAQNRLLRHARHNDNDNEDELLAAAFSTIATQVGEGNFAILMGVLVSARDKLRGALGDEASVADLGEKIAELLSVGIDESEQELLGTACASKSFNGVALIKAVAALDEGSDSDIARGRQIAEWLVADEVVRFAKLEDYCRIFITWEGKPRQTLATKPVREAAPDVAETLLVEQDRLLTLRERRMAIAVMHTSAALIRFGARMLDYYRQEKAARAVLDYGDQIMETRKLLSAEDIAPWVLYKLDGGLDHILVDESQDTSPAQWSVIAALAEEFFAGEGAHEGTRTIFAVGDEKQSIFSFQGADPEALVKMRAAFRRQVEAARQGWREVPLERSFRSTEAVLRAVDAVFAHADAAAGVVRPGETMHHDAARAGQGGLVEYWPIAVPRDLSGAASWAPPVTRHAGDIPSERLAGVIADKISGWVAAAPGPGEDGWLDAQNRPIRAGDVMVLVRRRGPLVAAGVGGLKARGSRNVESLPIEVAGVDRMKLTEQLAVMDLMALGDFLLLPSDDLTLAALLKGPFIGFDEEQLFALAWQRGKQSLWQTLSARRDENPAFSRAHEILSGLLAKADFQPSFEFYAEFLGAGGGRAQLLGRLGAEAADPIDEFLAAALAYERGHPPSLQGFLHWLRAAQTELKRDPEQARDEVRVMTVHGAKGLQAPIVFLPDTVTLPSDRRSILWAEEDENSSLPLWPGRRAREEQVCKALREQARERDMDEYRRLLYVAMTRAEDRLYVCGWQGKGVKNPPENCWNHIVRQGLENLEGTEQIDLEFVTDDGWSGDGLRFSCPQVAEATPATELAPDMAEIEELKPYFREPAPPEPVPSRPLAPSRRHDAPLPARGPLAEGGGSSFVRGRLIHRLLELLPEEAPAQRGEAAGRFLARPAHGLTAEAQTQIAAEVMAVLADGDAAPLFGPLSQAEVPLAAVIGKHVVSGQVDRLLVEENRVLVVDYKSGRPAPADDSAIPAAYLAQMADYRAVLTIIFPGREIRSALLFTDDPALVWLPDAALDAHAP